MLDAPGKRDFTYLRTGEGWLYLVAVIDLFSGMVIGWAMAEHMRASLCSRDCTADSEGSGMPGWRPDSLLEGSFSQRRPTRIGYSNHRQTVICHATLALRRQGDW
jgi:transposase InsO family protein